MSFCKYLIECQSDSVLFFILVENGPLIIKHRRRSRHKIVIVYSLTCFHVC